MHCKSIHTTFDSDKTSTYACLYKYLAGDLLLMSKKHHKDKTYSTMLKKRSERCTRTITERGKRGSHWLRLIKFVKNIAHYEHTEQSRTK